MCVSFCNALACSVVGRITFRQDWDVLADEAMKKAAEKAGGEEEKKSILSEMEDDDDVE